MSESQARYQTGGTARFVMYLEREDHTQLPLADVTAATFMLIDGRTRMPVNGRATQDVWNGGGGNHGFQFDEALDDHDKPVTRIGWDIDAADVALGDDAYRGEHLGQLLVTYNQGSAVKTLRHVHRLRIIDAPLLCTVADVANYVEHLNEDRTETVESMIEAFVCRAQLYCRRAFRIQQTTEVYSPSCYSKSIRACRFPIEQVIDIRESADGTFTNTGSILDAGSYYADRLGGYFERRYGYWLAGAGCVQASFIGGLCHGPEDAPGDLREAAARQVADDYITRDRSGVTNVSANQETVSYEERWSVTKRTKQILDNYARVMMPT